MSEQFIDLRSDTITKPSQAMRAAMAAAEVGDDVYGEDPTVNRLQERVASLLGKDAALFVPSGVMANQTALKIHTQPGDEVIAEAGSHVFNYETGGAAFISNVQVRTVAGVRGVMTADQVLGAVRSPVYYNSRSRLVCLENTHNQAGGTIYPANEIAKISALARQNDMRMHLDGARLWNAWVATGIEPKEYAKYFDTVSVCFSKGLGAPVGSALAGSADLIERARKIRKILGGGMRQAGILAAAALFALDHNVERLKEDHEKARLFAEQLGSLPGFSIDLETVQTNIVIIDIKGTGKSTGQILAVLRALRVLMSEMSPSTIRAVMHMDVSMDQVKEAVEITKSNFA
ncbi:MAG TPA: low-specificity L-threonine aldolase [Bacteroidota bacterium]|nr:low-specificity L-threonine aldolase [Bacteroidota bacterium]